MTTLTKIIVTTLLSLLFLSCNFDLNLNTVQGNGNVTTVERDISNNFTEIKTSRGLDVILTQGNELSLIVEADENLHDIIETRLEGETLVITSTENIGRAESKTIRLTFRSIERIKSTSGSDVYSTNTIRVEDLELKSTSGSDMELNIQTESLTCKSTSGSRLELTGQTSTLIAEATSGSEIDARELQANSSRVSATSGSAITVNSNKELIAKASSGGDVTYYGDPEKVQTSDGMSGSISKR